MNKLVKNLTKILIPVFIIVACLSPAFNITFADTENGWAAEDFTYDESIVTGLSEAGIAKIETNKDLVIPSQNVTGTAITGIGADAFKGEGLTSITFPDTIETIGKYAFIGNKITQVEIPKGVTVINAGAFAANKLTEIAFEENRHTLPEGIDIQSTAFGNNQLKTVRLPYNVKGIYSNAFMRNPGNDPEVDKLVYLYSENPSHLNNPNIYHYDGERDQNYSAFAKLIVEEKPWIAEDFTYDSDDETIITGFSPEGIDKLTDNKVLEIPLKNKEGNIITAISSNAFTNKGLTKVIFPEGLDEFTIDGSAFMSNNISEVTIPEGIRIFESQCFLHNKITELSLPQSTLKVGNSAFGDNEIASLTIADTKEKIQIDGNAFYDNNIKSFVLPYRVEKLAGTAFLNNPGMEPSSTDGSGIVYMYTSNANHFNNDRISRIGGTNPVPYQKLILRDSEYSDEWEVNDFTYEEGKITGLSESGTTKAISNKILVLPDISPQGEKITGIADNAFEVEADFSDDEVISPDGFTSVVFPKDLQSIGNNAFRYNNFTELSFPQSLEHIGALAFNSNKITALTLPENLTTMGAGAFGVNKLTTLEINHKLKVIPTGAFTSNTTLTNLEIPEGVEEIGSNAFAGAPLKTLAISSTVEKIGRSAFKLHRLDTLTVPGNVKYIDRNAFEGDGNFKTLKSLNLNEGLATIAKGAFNKNLLTRVDLPSSVTALDSKSFVDNSGCVRVYTTNEAHKDFSSDEKSHEIIFYSTEELWTAEDFIYDGTTLMGFSEEGKAKAVLYRYAVLPDLNLEGEKITIIGQNAFVPDDYDIIKEEIISPNGLNKVVLPKYLEVIEQRAFQYNNLTVVEFPDTLTTLKLQCFNGNKLQKLVIPETITNIEEGAFSTNKLTDVTLPDNMKVIPKGLFARNITLQHIDIPQGVEIIDEYAFNGAQLKSLDIPDSVTEIRRGAFYYHQIKELEIPGSVKVLGHRAFSGTTKAIRLEKLVLNEGLEEIGSEAFAVSLLKEVYLPKSLEKLDATAFDHNTGFESSGKINLYTRNKNHLDFPDSASYNIIYRKSSSSGSHKGSSTAKTPGIVLPKETLGGKVAISVDNRTVNIVPDEGYEIADLIIDGNSVGALNSYEFSDDKDHSVEVIFKEKINTGKFADINDHWAKNSIDFVIANGLFCGVSDDEFAPDYTMTRSMLVTVLYRYENNPEINSSPSFKDVQDKSWYGDGVAWAANADIVKGLTDDFFAPNEKLTREQLIVILYRYAQYKGIDTTVGSDLSSYNDSNEIADWSNSAMEWAVSAGLLQGRNNKMLAPGDVVTRGESAMILTKFIEEIL
ncbi:MULTISPECIES: leucine-rich repeat protein [unclassified Sedimentibacter]|uniref:leucine-rich repeat protein n=1 Tax=unclassified Sedimentibacter TaxID=2649220 RepID=UPI0027E10EEC|nr:leucine-rich repeat protein [Sedimentibacter sp. MB35-C1]WMJ77396.1 leucine-rich repeat protein [Sedimentibacter sp. MB35-C1]